MSLAVPQIRPSWNERAVQHHILDASRFPCKARFIRVLAPDGSRGRGGDGRRSGASPDQLESKDDRRGRHRASDQRAPGPEPTSPSVPPRKDSRGIRGDGLGGSALRSGRSPLSSSRRSHRPGLPRPRERAPRRNSRAAPPAHRFGRSARSPSRTLSTTGATLSPLSPAPHGPTQPNGAAVPAPRGRGGARAPRANPVYLRRVSACGRRPRVTADSLRARYAARSHSTPSAFRRNSMAAQRVVPVPANGSSTVSPMTENIRMRRSGIACGNAPERPRADR